MRKLSTDLYRQTVLSGDENELPLDDRIQFLQTEDFGKSLKESDCELLREGMRGRDLKDADIFPSFQGFPGKGIADAPCRDSLLSVSGKQNFISFVVGEDIREVFISRHDFLMIRKGKTRKDDPSL